MPVIISSVFRTNHPAYVVHIALRSRELAGEEFLSEHHPSCVLEQPQPVVISHSQVRD
jgi:hypothetical protein